MRHQQVGQILPARQQARFRAPPGREEAGKRTRSGKIMKLLKRMQNPFALVGQGFVLGGVLFFATHAESLLASPAPAQPSASLVMTVAPGR